MPLKNEQHISSNTIEEADIFAIYQNGSMACIEVFFFRLGQGAEQRFIWYNKHGLVRLAKKESLQLRSKKARCKVFTVRETAPALANGP